jgi:histidinol-phosphate aminotransferase
MILPRPEVLATPPVPHGGAADPAVLDFSANLNPFGPSPAVIAAVRAANWERYPDPAAGRLRGLLAARLGVAPERLLVGNGSSELIDLVCRAFLRPGDVVRLAEPCYGEYARSARLCGADLATDADRPARLLFVCTPNNPLGTLTPADELTELADRWPDTLVVADEAYADCVPGFRSLAATGQPRPNLLVLRSLTKAHGLAGLRVGYAVGPADVVEALRRVQPPWSVNALALVAAEAAVAEEAHTARTALAWLRLRDELVAALRPLGIEPRVAATPFFLLPNPPGLPWYLRMRRHGIAVRDATSFGLPQFARVSPRLGPDNLRLLAAVREELSP